MARSEAYPDGEVVGTVNEPALDYLGVWVEDDGASALRFDIEILDLDAPPAEGEPYDEDRVWEHDLQFHFGSGTEEVRVEVWLGADEGYEHPNVLGVWVCQRFAPGTDGWSCDGGQVDWATMTVDERKGRFGVEVDVDAVNDAASRLDPTSATIAPGTELHDIFVFGMSSKTVGGSFYDFAGDGYDHRTGGPYYTFGGGS